MVSMVNAFKHRDRQVHDQKNVVKDASTKLLKPILRNDIKNQKSAEFHLHIVESMTNIKNNNFKGNNIHICCDLHSYDLGNEYKT